MNRLVRTIHSVNRVNRFWFVNRLVRESSASDDSFRESCEPFLVRESSGENRLL